MAESNEITIIASDTKIKGEMTFQKAAKILGTFEGKINAKGELQIAPTANCKADVECNGMVLDGTIEGNVTAMGKIQLNSNGKIQGDIVAEKLVTAEGASIYGQVAVGPDAVKNIKASGGGSAPPSGGGGDKGGKSGGKG